MTQLQSKTKAQNVSNLCRGGEVDEKKNEGEVKAPMPEKGKGFSKTYF